MWGKPSCCIGACSSEALQPLSCQHNNLQIHRGYSAHVTYSNEEDDKIVILRLNLPLWATDWIYACRIYLRYTCANCVFTRFSFVVPCIAQPFVLQKLPPMRSRHARQQLDFLQGQYNRRELVSAKQSASDAIGLCTPRGCSHQEKATQEAKGANGSILRGKHSILQLLQ